MLRPGSLANTLKQGVLSDGETFLYRRGEASEEVKTVRIAPQTGC
jgi:hypothetical protein